MTKIDIRGKCRKTFYFILFDLFLAGQNGGARRIRTDDILLAKQALYQLSYSPVFWERGEMVGLVRFELTTSRLSSARSNQLSYKPALY
jgi:hypothetical protein